MAPLLKAVQLRKRFAHPIAVEVLKGIDLELHPGEAVAITGASGEGKSTLLHILGALEEPSAGELYLYDRPFRTYNQAKLRNRHIGFIFQGFHLLEDCSVIQNILMPARIARRPIEKRSEAYRYAEQLLEEVGLSQRRDFAVQQLSGGEKQRVAIARALCNNPDLLIADEPSGNLDHATAERIHSLLLAAVKQRSKTLLVATHNALLAKQCDRLLTLENGRLASSVG